MNNKRIKHLILTTTKGHFLRNNKHKKLRLLKQNYIKSLQRRNVNNKLKKRYVNRMLADIQSVKLLVSITKKNLVQLHIFEPKTLLSLLHIKDTFFTK